MGNTVAERLAKAQRSKSTAQKGTGGTKMTQVAATKWQPEVTLTQDQFAKLGVDDVYNHLSSRISQERAQSILLDLVGEGRIAITDPTTLTNWTFKRVVVKGIAYDGPGYKTPKVELTKEKFGKLTAEEMAEILTGNISVERAKAIVLALLRDGVVKPTAEEIVHWSYNRIAIEGIEPKWSFGTGGIGAKRVEVSIAGVVAKSAA